MNKVLFIKVQNDVQVPIKMNTDNIICTFLYDDFTTNRKNLFIQALNYARHGKVLYVLSKEINELPELSQNINNVSRDTMKLISFMYVQSLDSLIASISTLHNWENVPSTIILDDLTSYCDKDNLQNACGVVALLLDTIKICAVSLSAQCRLTISVNRDVVDEYFFNSLNDLYNFKTN